MSWQLYVRSAETVLESTKVPSSQEIISLIKRVNPTTLHLPETDREHGYRIKNHLQNLLLENYGEAFHLAPHPYSPDIILIKHNALPSIDACHADLNALSAKALDTVGYVAPASARVPARSEAKGKATKQATVCSPKEVLRNAELLLEQYEYPQAEELLASLRIADTRDLPTLVKAAGLLAGEMGAYQRAIDVLLAQPRQVLKDKEIRELLALTYYGNGMIPEARALFDAAHTGDLGKNALYAYADISLKDGNLAQAYHLLKLSEEKEGFVTAHASLRKEIEAAMLDEAEPFFREAEGAVAGGDVAQAESLLRKALSLYPNFQKAHQLVAEIEARKTASALDRLWERFDSSEMVAERLDLLAQLLEQDRGRSEKIKDLMARERSRQKQEAVEARIDTLRAFAAQEQWDECFDILLWLSREADDDVFRRTCQVAPYFSVLYRNQRLLRLPDQEAKEVWLSFVRLKRLAQQGRAEGCWDLVHDLKPYFRSYALFKEEYDRALELEQAKARDDVQRLLNRLKELDQDEEANLTEARRVVALMRKQLIFLPAEESASCKEYAEAVLNRMELQTVDEVSILHYHEALLLGNFAKAAQLRESHGQKWEGLIKMVEDQIAQEFAISAEPVTLAVSPDLVVDLATESAPLGLDYLCSSERHLLFRENDETIVVVNVRRMSATRYRSPNFKGLAVMDMLPEKDLFLFVNTETKNTVWRAILSETESRFTATYQINEHFHYGENSEFKALFMSNAKDNAYYAYIRDEENLRFVKQNVSLVSNVERTVEVAGEPKAAFRLSYLPERFVIVTDSNTAVLESNLTPTRGCSRLGASHTLCYLAIDTERSEIYALGDGIVNVLNPKLRAVKQYLKAACAAHLEIIELASLCVEQSTALLNIGGKGIFYNMETNKFSQKFSMSRMVHTETPARWYYWDFDATTASIALKDITEEVDTLLEWQVLLSAGEDEAGILEFVEKLGDPAFFTIVRSADQQQTSDAT